MRIIKDLLSSRLTVTDKGIVITRDLLVTDLADGEPWEQLRNVVEFPEVPQISDAHPSKAFKNWHVIEVRAGIDPSVGVSVSVLYKETK